MAAQSGSPESVEVFSKQLVRKLSIPLTIAVLVYAALLFYGDARAVGNSLTQLHASAIGLGIGLSIGSFALRGLRWQLYLRVMKLRVPLLESAIVFLCGLGMSITPGKVGELLKSMMLKERYDVPIARSAPVVVAERLTDLVALVLLGLGSLLWSRSQLAACAASALLLLGLYAFGRSHRLGSLAVSVLCLVPPVRKHREKLLTAHASLRELWSAGPFALACVLAISAWSLQALTVTVFAAEFGQNTLSLTDALIAFSAPLLAGTLALIPGGLGLTEASMAGTLRALSGMPTSTATAITITTRIATFWIAIVIGLSALALWRALRRTPAPAHGQT